jgi:tRNA-dihydrouridine synthase
VDHSVEHGVDALAIHGRTVCDRYRGMADWDILAEVKSRLHRATIIGSGDIFDPVDTVDLMKKTGLDGFIVARGAIGNPWIFRDLRCVWENRPIPAPPSLEEQRLIILEHFERILKDHPEKKAVGIFRKYAVGYVNLHPERKKVLKSFMKAGTCAHVKDVINTWYTNNSQGI